MSPSGVLIRAPQAATILHHRRSGYRNKRRGGVARVQKHTKAEEETIVFNGSSLTTGAVLVEKEDSKVPSNRINIIPNNGRCVFLQLYVKPTDVRRSEIPLTLGCPVNSRVSAPVCMPFPFL